MSIMNNEPFNTLSSNNIDVLVLTEFPFPIAFSYRQMLQSESWEMRIRRCVTTFEILVRTITLEVLANYLDQDPVLVNNRDLNRILYKRLARPSLGQWVDFLFLGMRAYEGYQDLLSIPELYDLFWDSTKQPNEFRRGVRQPYTRLVEIRNDIAHRAILLSDESWEKKWRDALNNFQQILSTIEFLKNYNLIRVTGIIGEEYYFERYSSQDITLHRGSIPSRGKLKEGWFYFVSRTLSVVE